MLALAAPSAGWQAFLFIVAFIALLFATVLSLLPAPKNWWGAFVAGGLAAWVLVLAWTALAAT